MLVHLNAKQADDPDGRWHGPVPTLEQYLDNYAHFGARTYGPHAPRTHRSPFDAKQVRFLRTFNAIDFVPNDVPDARWRNLELSVDAKAQLELVPYGSDDFRQGARTAAALTPHFVRLLDVIAEVDRTHVLFCGVVFDTLLGHHITQTHSFRLRKNDGTLTVGKYRFSNAEIPHQGKIIRAGIASSYAIQGIPMSAYIEVVHIDRLDHLVLTVTDLDATIEFYCGVLGMTDIVFGEGRHALTFGTSKINLHQAGNEFEPKAWHPEPGSADLCFVVEEPIDEVLRS